MKLKAKANNGLFEAEFEGDVKSVFDEVGKFQEIFDVKCGKCGSKELHFVVRNAQDKKGKSYKYYEIRCKKCGAVLALGQSEEGGLFPKRKDEEGNYLPNNGWVKYNKETGTYE